MNLNDHLDHFAYRQPRRERCVVSGVDAGRLREMAEAATPERLGEDLQDHRRRWREFEGAANPDAVLALLDELEAARAAVERVRALADLGVREQWPPDEWRAGIRAALDGER